DAADTMGGLGPTDVALAGHNHDSVYAKLNHNHDSAYYPQSTLNTAGTVNTASNPVDWTKLKNVPAGFADGIDNDSGADITEVSAGPGLTGGGTAGAVSLAVSFAGTGAATTVARADHNHDSKYVEGNFAVRAGQLLCTSGGCASETVNFNP